MGERPDESVIDEVFSKLDSRVLPVFTFIRETGCRKGEAITLDRSQIDFSRAQVVFHSNTKNGRSRQVPLTESALCAIAAMPAQTDTVFYHPDTLRTWTFDGVSIPWERARRSAGHRKCEFMVWATRSESSSPRKGARCTTSARSLGITRSTLLESITPGSVPTQHQRTFFGCWKDGKRGSDDLGTKLAHGFFMKLADGCKLLRNLVATGGIEPPTLGL